jgi:probable addiction module antidote protein
MMMITKTKTFDVAEFLEDEETIAEYLNMALEDPNPEMLLLAVRNIARARGMTQLARDTSLHLTHKYLR